MIPADSSAMSTTPLFVSRQPTLSVHPVLLLCTLDAADDESDPTSECGTRTPTGRRARAATHATGCEYTNQAAAASSQSTARHSSRYEPLSCADGGVFDGAPD